MAVFHKSNPTLLPTYVNHLNTPTILSVHPKRAARSRRTSTSFLCSSQFNPWGSRSEKSVLSQKPLSWLVVIAKVSSF